MYPNKQNGVATDKENNTYARSFASLKETNAFVRLIIDIYWADVNLFEKY